MKYIKIRQTIKCREKETEIELPSNYNQKENRQQKMEETERKTRRQRLKIDENRRSRC